MSADIAPAALRKVPPGLQHTVSRRGVWSLCALEQSRFGPVDMEVPPLPFHHLALPLDRERLKMGMRVDGHRHAAQMGPNEIGVVAAGDGGAFWWDRPADSACVYFTSAALGAALGCEVGEDTHALRSKINLHAPGVVRLLRALHADAGAGQPHGNLIGDAVFVALAAQLVPGRRIGSGPSVPDWRVRRALEYIHAHLTGELDLRAIAAAAATSPFHLSRAFRMALGCTIWQYVLRERARCAFALMRDDPQSSLAGVAQASGFDTYASFIAAVRREYGHAPARLRAALRA